MPTILLLAILLIVIIAGGGFWVYSKRTGKSAGEVHTTSLDADANERRGRS